MSISKKRRGLKLGEKLVISMVFLVLFSCLVITFILTQRNNRFVENEFIQEIDKALSTFEIILGEEKEGMLMAFHFLSGNRELKVAIRDGDRLATSRMIDSYYQWLREEFFISHMQVIEPDLRSFYRAHNPHSYGDLLDFRQLLLYVLETQSISQAFEGGVYGYVLRTTGPLFDDEGNLLALLELGMNLDNTYIDEVSALVGADLTVFQGNERITTTIFDDTGERAVGTTIENPIILDGVLKEGERWAGRLEIVGGHDIYGAYTPIFDVHGNIDGMLFAGYSAYEVDAYQRDNLIMVGIILFIILLFSIVLALFLARRITGPIKVISAVLTKMSEGDFTQEVQVKARDETGEIASAVNTTMESLRMILGKVQISSHAVASSSQDISSGNQDLSQRTQEQASSLEEISSTIEEITNSLESSSGNAGEADSLSRESLTEVNQGGEVVEELRLSMVEITESSKRIGEIIGTVNDIAFQTNLLALNAAVEAARAGEQGRGFAVVASEVRNLAHRAKEASSEIESLIKESIQRVSKGNELMETTEAVLGSIVENTQRTTQIIGEISSSLSQQSAGALEIREALQELNQATQQNASLVEEVASSSESMNTEAIELAELIKVFSLHTEEK